MSQLSSPPFIEVAGIHNFRDIGGYAVKDEATSSVRQRFIYRCAAPDRVLPAGKKKIQDLGITCVYDLRSKPEIERQKLEPWQIEGVQRVFAPAFADTDYSPEAIALRYKDYAHGGVEVCIGIPRTASFSADALWRASNVPTGTFWKMQDQATARSSNTSVTNPTSPYYYTVRLAKTVPVSLSP